MNKTKLPALLKLTLYMVKETSSVTTVEILLLMSVILKI